jgi:hypothetical protein
MATAAHAQIRLRCVTQPDAAEAIKDFWFAHRIIDGLSGRSHVHDRVSEAFAVRELTLSM